MPTKLGRNETVDRLPSGVRRDMEALLGLDLRDVLVHQGDEPAAIGARAFARGRHLYFAPGVYDPGSPEGLRLLAHELAHVRQQSEGRTPRLPGDGSFLVRNPELEAEAEHFARKAVDPARARSLPRRPLDPMGECALRPDGAVQPKITVNQTMYGYNNNKYQPFGTLWQGVVNSAYMKRAPLSREELVSVKKKLIEWAKAARNPSFINLKKTVSQNKVFGSFDELARAAIGYVNSMDNRTHERWLAKKVYDSEYMRGQLKSLVRLVAQWHDNNKDRYRTALEYDADDDRYYRIFEGGSGEAEREKGRYSYYYGRKPLGAAMRELANGRKKVSKLVTFLADYAMVSRYLHGQADAYEDPDTNQVILANTIANLDTYQNSPEMSARGNHWTPDETDAWTQAARENKVPLGAGPSATTLNALALAQAAQANLPQKEALAWGLFAFWNRTASRKRGEIHTFHEVMTVAMHYGVRYALNQYPSDIPPTQNPTLPPSVMKPLLPPRPPEREARVILARLNL